MCVQMTLAAVVDSEHQDGEDKTDKSGMISGEKIEEDIMV